MNETLPNAVLCVGMLNCDVYFRNTPKNLMRTDTSFMRDVTMLVGGDAMAALLKLDEFQNPATGLNFQATGKLTTPIGAELLRTDAVGANKILALDRRYALEMVQAGEVSVEYDKLIDRQLERAAITSTSGFAKIYADASKVLEIS